MFAPINAVCALDAGVIAVLGSAPQRLYPFGDAPQDGQKPYAVWQTIGGDPENYLAAPRHRRLHASGRRVCHDGQRRQGCRQGHKRRY